MGDFYNLNDGWGHPVTLENLNHQIRDLRSRVMELENDLVRRREENRHMNLRMREFVKDWGKETEPDPTDGPTLAAVKRSMRSGFED